MKSAATLHFPMFRFIQSKKWLFNPVLKKRFANLPEERVRLRWIDYLLSQTTWKKNRIGFEAPVQLRQDDHKTRADIVLYDETLVPVVLAECKAPTVSLDGKTALQAARYNSSVDARYLLLTNGIDDYWFDGENKFSQMNESPLEPFRFVNRRWNDEKYWIDRAFMTPDFSENNRRWMVNLLIHFWNNSQKPELTYLPFRDSPVPFPIDHYYRFFEFEDEKKMAVTIQGIPGVGNYLVAVLNRKNQNEGIMTIRLDPSEKSNEPVLRIYQGQNISESDGSDAPLKPGTVINDELIQQLPQKLIHFFD